jgi:hypothetical protein
MLSHPAGKGKFGFGTSRLSPFRLWQRPCGRFLYCPYCPYTPDRNCSYWPITRRLIHRVVARSCVDFSWIPVHATRVEGTDSDPSGDLHLDPLPKTNHSKYIEATLKNDANSGNCGQYLSRVGKFSRDSGSIRAVGIFPNKKFRPFRSRNSLQIKWCAR